MSDNEDTSGGTRGNISDEEGYDSSGSYLESCLSSIDFSYSEEENYFSEDDDTYCHGDETKLLNKDISAAISEREPVPEMEYIWGRKNHEFRDDNSSNMQWVEIILGTHKVKVSCAGTAKPILFHTTLDLQKSTDDKCDSELAESVDAPKSETAASVLLHSTCDSEFCYLGDECDYELSESGDDKSDSELSESVDDKSDSELSESGDDKSDSELSESVDDKSDSELSESVDDKCDSELAESVDAPILLDSNCDWLNYIGDECDPELAESGDHKSDSELSESVDDKCDSELADSVDGPKSEMPLSRTAWKATWLEKRKKSNNVLVNVYAYFKKGELFAGHAVIVRDDSLVPIAATAYFTKFGLSYLHNMLLGIGDAIRLASDHGYSCPAIVCNSRFLAQLLGNVASHSCDCDINTGDTICVSCTSKYAPRLDKLYWKNLVPFIQEVRSMQRYLNIKWDSGKNEAVHYLAKQVKMNSMYHGRPADRWDMKKPEDYTDRLVNILFEDANNPVERIGIIDMTDYSSGIVIDLMSS